MAKFLITPSLLNSYSYYMGDDYKSPADSRADFLKTLSRDKFEPNEAMAKGIFFEDSVNDFCKGALKIEVKEPCYWDCVKSIGEIVKGGLWQQSVKKEIKVGNQEFLLYGRTDVIKRDTIYDIKFTSNYELGKFLDSSQNLIYLYCSGLPNFSYLISDGKDWWREDYHNHTGIEDKLKSKISDFMNYLENDQEVKKMFLAKWQSKQSTKE